MAISNTNTSSARSAMQSSTVRGAAMVTIGLGIGRVFAYLLSLARPGCSVGQYGIFGSMLALLMVGGDDAGIQAVAPERIVSRRKVGAVRRWTRRGSVRRLGRSRRNCRNDCHRTGHQLAPCTLTAWLRSLLLH